MRRTSEEPWIPVQFTTDKKKALGIGPEDGVNLLKNYGVIISWLPGDQIEAWAKGNKALGLRLYNQFWNQADALRKFFWATPIRKYA